MSCFCCDVYIISQLETVVFEVSYGRACFVAGDMEFKQNKFLPVEKQIVTADPDVNTVCIFILCCIGFRA